MVKFASGELATMAASGVFVEALAAREKLDEAFEAKDVDAVSALFSEDLIVNSPGNRVARR